MDKQTIFDWIKKIIETSNNDFHFEGIDRLIELFYERYSDGEMRTQLNNLRENKWNEIHTILK